MARRSRKKDTKKSVTTVVDNVNITDKVEVTEKETVVEEKQTTNSVKKEKKKEEKIILKFRSVRVYTLMQGQYTVYTMKPANELKVSPTSIYEFDIDQDYDIVKLISPYDIVFEIVSVGNKKIKLRPRLHYNIKEDSIIGYGIKF